MHRPRKAKKYYADSELKTAFIEKTMVEICYETNFPIKMLCASNKLHLSAYPRTPSGFSLSNLYYFASIPESGWLKMRRQHLQHGKKLNERIVQLFFYIFLAFSDYFWYNNKATKFYGQVAFFPFLYHKV